MQQSHQTILGKNNGKLQEAITKKIMVNFKKLSQKK